LARENILTRRANHWHFSNIAQFQDAHGAGGADGVGSRNGDAM
jgi:hypothetical protein